MHDSSDPISKGVLNGGEKKMDLSPMTETLISSHISYDTCVAHQYHRLEDAAIDLQIEKLEEWIKTKTYLKAISVESSVRTMKLTDSSQFQSLDPMRLSGDVDIERKVFTRTKKVYLCPRGIPVHRGRQYACGLACQNARNGAPLEYDHETYLEVVSIYKKYIIDKSMCMEEI
jgi:hypothetical protein